MRELRPGERIAAAPPKKAVARPGFLSMAGTKLHVPFFAAISAALVLFLLMFAVPLVGRLPTWAFFLPAFAFLGAVFWGWIDSNRRLETLQDIPASKIVSAAQGYVTLEGRAAQFPGQPLVSPLTAQACCWYSYRVTVRDDERKTYRITVRGGEWGGGGGEHETSEWSFMLSDGTGDCVVDPVGARLIAVRSRHWSVGNFNYTESLIVPGDPLLVTGKFASSGAGVTEQDLELRTGLRVTEWKKDMPALRERFGLPVGGQFRPNEWERVLSKARREVEDELATDPPQPQNQVSNPGDGRPYVISARSRRLLERDLKIWAWLHLACFVLGAVILAAWVSRHQ